MSSTATDTSLLSSHETTGHFPPQVNAVDFSIAQPSRFQGEMNSTYGRTIGRWHGKLFSSKQRKVQMSECVVRTFKFDGKIEEAMYFSLAPKN
jgi:hypothetical protein